MSAVLISTAKGGYTIHYTRFKIDHMTWRSTLFEMNF